MNLIIVQFTILLFYNLIISSINGDDHTKIVIIGGGVAGISTASRLFELGFSNVKILEAESRIGGRILTKKIDNTYYEMGLFNEVNYKLYSPVYIMAKNHELLEEINATDEYEVFKTNGKKLNSATFNKMIFLLDNILDENNAVKYPNNTILQDYVVRKFNILQNTKKNRRFIKDNMKESVLRFYETKMYEMFMFDDWQNEYRKVLFEYKTMPDESYLFKGNGYENIFDILLKKQPDGLYLPVDIQLNTKVTRIYWNRNDGRIIVETATGNSITADKVVVTLPLGVLKLNHQTIFQPKLPNAKIKAIENLNVATVNRLYIEFDSYIWNENQHDTFIIWTDVDAASLIGNREWMKGINRIGRVEKVNVDQRHIIEIEIVGKYAQYFEEISDDNVKIDILWILNKLTMFENIPNIKSMIRSNWFSHPSFHGSNSYHGISSYLENVTSLMLKEPLKNRDGVKCLFFAGEATHENDYGTVDGAIISGFEAAQNIYQSVF